MGVPVTSVPAIGMVPAPANLVSDTLFVTLLYGLLVYAVVLGWISFISAFPACRFI